ncbi:uncharacterized protein B0I36DRAFT_328802, partial [Microdochium trichocladiopsis]
HDVGAAGLRFQVVPRGVAAEERLRLEATGQLPHARVSFLPFLLLAGILGLVLINREHSRTEGLVLAPSNVGPPAALSEQGQAGGVDDGIPCYEDMDSVIFEGVERNGVQHLCWAQDKEIAFGCDAVEPRHQPGHLVEPLIKGRRRLALSSCRLGDGKVLALPLSHLRYCDVERRQLWLQTGVDGQHDDGLADKHPVNEDDILVG